MKLGGFVAGQGSFTSLRVPYVALLPIYNLFFHLHTARVEEKSLKPPPVCNISVYAARRKPRKD
eukprot:767807-Hanusia_phi.AAC.2